MDLLAAVREATAGARSARFSQHHRGLTPDGVVNPRLGAEGVVDLAACRTRFFDAGNETVVDGPRLLARWGDDRCFLEWHQGTDGISAHHPFLPLLDAVTLAGEPERAGDATLRGETVARWRVTLSVPSTPPPEP